MTEKNIKKVKQGKKNRASGAAFELRVRKDLEEKGWIVDKWSNNVEFETAILASADGKESIRREHKFGKLIPAKHKFRGPGIPMAMGTGFPDFICFTKEQGWTVYLGEYEIRYAGELKKGQAAYQCVIGVEVKSNGYLKPEEKQKCQWLLDNNIFSKILIASKHKIKNRIHIEYKEFVI